MQIIANYVWQTFPKQFSELHEGTWVIDLLSAAAAVVDVRFPLH